MSISASLSLLLGLVAGVALRPALNHFVVSWGLPPPCLDVYTGAPLPTLYAAGGLHTSGYGRPGLSHATLAGARHHGMRGLELWLQTFAPGAGTPIHRHSCEEVFWVQHGSGTAYVRDASGAVHDYALHQNDTLVVLPDSVHQIRNTGMQDLQLLVAFDRPPIRVHTYGSWGTANSRAQLQWPYHWDVSCPLRLPAGVQHLQARQRDNRKRGPEL